VFELLQQASLPRKYLNEDAINISNIIKNSAAGNDLQRVFYLICITIEPARRVANPKAAGCIKIGYHMRSDSKDKRNVLLL